MNIVKLKEYNNIYYCDAYLKEMQSLMAGYGGAKKFERWLLSQLEILDDPEINFMDFKERFEKIEPELYAITYRRRSEKNPRILFTVEDGQVKLLLCCFDEKKTDADYERAKKKARSRCKDMQKQEGKWHE